MKVTQHNIKQLRGNLQLRSVPFTRVITEFYDVILSYSHVEDLWTLVITISGHPDMNGQRIATIHNLSKPNKPYYMTTLAN